MQYSIVATLHARVHPRPEWLQKGHTNPKLHFTHSVGHPVLSTIHSVSYNNKGMFPYYITMKLPLSWKNIYTEKIPNFTVVVVAACNASWRWLNDKSLSLSPYNCDSCCKRNNGYGKDSGSISFSFDHHNHHHSMKSVTYHTRQGLGSRKRVKIKNALFLLVKLMLSYENKCAYVVLSKLCTK